MTRDEAIAEAFRKWPDARVFVRGDNGVVYARTTQDLWHSRGPADTRWYLTVNPLPRVPDDFTEIPRPTALPDRDLAAYVDQVEDLITSLMGVMVNYRLGPEPEPTPTPPAPSPLDAEPGSRWRDPETGTEWVKGLKLFAQVVGGVVNGAALVPGYSDDLPIIARLVSVPIHETVSTEAELDALPESTVVQSGTAFYQKRMGKWHSFWGAV